MKSLGSVIRGDGFGNGGRIVVGKIWGRWMRWRKRVETSRGGSLVGPNLRCVRLRAGVTKALGEIIWWGRDESGVGGEGLT